MTEKIDRENRQKKLTESSDYQKGLTLSRQLWKLVFLSFQKYTNIYSEFVDEILNINEKLNIFRSLMFQRWTKQI